MKDNNIPRRMKLAASQNIKERDYWVNKLSGNPVKSFFPYDRRGAVIGERHPETVDFQMDPGLSANLIRVSGSSDKRLHMILAAALAVLLDKYSGSRDIILGTPIYKQETKEKFINTLLPLRIKPQPHMTFKQLILQVKQTVMEAAENQNYPMKTLLYKLNISSSDTTGFELFDVAILLENIHNKSYLADINYNLLFSLIRTGESIQGNLEYNALLYDKTSIQRIIRHYRHLLQVVFSNLDLPLEKIDILSPEEKHRILSGFNDTEVDYPKDKTIHQLLEAQVEKTPDKIALVYNHRYLSYRELNEKTNQLAGLLRAKGLQPGGIVGILMEPSPELIIGIVGILKAGGAYLPTDPQYPRSRVLSILRDSNISILLTRESITKTIPFTVLRDIGASGVAPVVTAPRGQIKDLDSLPFPDRTLIDYEKYHQCIGIAPAKHTVSIQGTRGCPYNCAYCHKIWPKSHVVRSAENIFEEIKQCYQAGARRFAFIDDVFNLKKDNMARLMEKIIKNRLNIQLFFANGLRGDILTRELVDLMVEAGTVDVDLALESASPRIQKLISKNLNIEKFREIAQYFTGKYPGVILEMELMIGFPTETVEEVLMTLDFLKSLKWVHFPNLNVLKIYPNSDMYRLAVKHGISPEQIKRSTNQAFHELPHTLPFSKSFAGQLQMRFMNEYFLSKERLQHIVPHQVKVLTVNELVQKYDSYLPMKIRDLSDILNLAGISTGESNLESLPEDHMAAPGFRENMKKYFPAPDAKDQDDDALRVLLLDLSLLFFSSNEELLYNMVEEPMGLAYLLTYLNKTFGRKIHGKIGKSKADFDSFDQLKAFIRDFNPHIIGVRTLSFYKEFFHKSIALIRQWGIDAPIITGGPYATSDYASVLSDPNIDLVVLGEGELTFAHLIEKIMENSKKLPEDEVLEKIPGIAFIKKQDKPLIKRAARDVTLLDNTRGVLAPYPKENPVHVNQPTDLLYLISTSGSTGKPKSLAMEHRNLANLMHFQLKETAVDFDRVLQFASIGFDVSSQEIFSTLLAGGRLYLIDSKCKRDVNRLLEWIDKNHINVIYWPPAFLKYVFSEAEYRSIFPKSIKHIIAAGEPLVVTEPIREYIKNHQVYLHNHYGPAETHVVTTFVMEPTGTIPELPPIGKPISNNRVYILDENRNKKPIGAIGEIYIAGDNVGRGYLDRPELTARKFPEGNIYRTGDLARWLPDGNIEFIDRTDFQVKIRGFRVEPGEIENRLEQIDFIKEALVVGHKDTAGENFLCAYIVSQKEVEISQIRDILADDLPHYMVPSSFVQIEKIPVTPNGKIDKKALPLPEFNTGVTYEPPRDEVDRRLVDIWADVLTIEKDSISIDTDFFQLGGNSLKAIILVSRVKKEFNQDMPIIELFNSPTIRHQAEYIKNTGDEMFWGTHHDLILLRKKSGKAKHLFFVHDGTGEVEGYFEFCKQLESTNLDFNCWGIELEKTGNYAPYNVTIEEIAHQYIEKIKKLQGSGPYYIGGWCVGGTIAFEIVRQLERQKESIAFLALIDSPSPQDCTLQTSLPFTPEGEKNFIRKDLPTKEIPEKLETFTEIDQIWPFIVNYLENRNIDTEIIKKLIMEHEIRIIPNYNNLTIGKLIEYLNKVRTLLKTRERYIPPNKVQAPVHFFSARQSKFKGEPWNHYCHKPIEIYEVHGDHFSIFKAPHVIEFAGTFTRAFRV